MFAAVCKIVTTEKCTIIQTAGVVSYNTSSVMAYICYFVHYQQVAHNKVSYQKIFYRINCSQMSLLMCQFVSFAQQRNQLQQKVLKYSYLVTFRIYLFSMVVIKDLLALCEDKCFLVHFQHFIFHPIFRILQSAPASCSNLAMFSCPHDTYFKASGSVPVYPLPCLPSNPETLTLG